jgi:DNA-binding transcriptional LysR family regulator
VKDGEQIFLAVVSDGAWKAFCGAFGFGDLAADERLATNNQRVRARDWLMPDLRQRLAGHSAAELARVFEAMDKLKAFRIVCVGGHARQPDGRGQGRRRGPAIMGRRLDALEEHLGVKLLVRTTRRISLTHEGSAFLEDCQRLLADVANAEASVSEGGVKATGHLRITAPAGFGRRHVAPLVPRFRELHPDVTISLNLSDRVVDLAGEGYDCAVRVGDLPDSSLVSVRMADNRRLCVATPAYLQRHGTPRHPSDLAQFDCLTLSSEASQTRGWAFRMPLDPGAAARGGAPQARRPAGLLRRPGAARLVPGGLRHCLAQHLGGRGGIAAGRLVEVLEDFAARPTAFTWCFPSASTCRCGCGCGLRQAHLLPLIPLAAVFLARGYGGAG